MICPSNKIFLDWKFALTCLQFLLQQLLQFLVEEAILICFIVAAFSLK